MNGIRIERSNLEGESRGTVSIIFGNDPAASNLPSHCLYDWTQSDRILFQLPPTKPRARIFESISLPNVIRQIPGIFTVEAISAVKLMRRQNEIISIEHPEYYKNPSFVAILASGEDRFHPLDIQQCIHRVIDVAYRPDAVLIRMGVDPEVETLPIHRRTIY